MMSTDQTQQIVRASVRRACLAVRADPAAGWTSRRLATVSGTTPVRLRRAFREVLGLSPRDFIVACKRERFLNGVRRGGRVTDAIYDAGFGSPSRVYDAIRLPGMTPATYGRGGRGAHIRWRTVASPVGRILVAATDRGLCFVQVGRSEADLVRQLTAEFPRAVVEARPSEALAPWASAALAVTRAERPDADLPVDVRGTAFQWRVWRALTRIPRGETRSYAEIAQAIGAPRAVRAVGRACATNPLALVVPCHRVVPTSGGPGGYRWGTSVKETLLDRERRSRGRSSGRR